MNARFPAVLAALLVATLGCEARKPPLVELPPAPVTVSHPIPRKVTDVDDYTGTTESTQTVEVRARVSGYLTKILFDDGAVVREGDLLFQIDPRPYKTTYDEAQAQVARAEAQLALAKAEYDRNEPLVAKKIVTAADFNKLIADVRVAEAAIQGTKAAVASAKLNLDFTRIEAPIDGRIGRPLITVGNLVTASPAGGILLTTIVSIDPIYVYFDIDEQSLLRYRQNSKRDKKGNRLPVKEAHIPVQMALAGEKDYPHQGLIDFADNKVNSSTGSIRVRGVFANPDGELLPGLFARIRVPAGDEHETLLVSERALGSDQGQRYLLVVNAENKVESKRVEIGRLQDGLRAINSGISAEDWVIVDGMIRARVGAKVDPRQAPMPEPTTATTAERPVRATDAKATDGGAPDRKPAAAKRNSEKTPLDKASPAKASAPKSNAAKAKTERPSVAPSDDDEPDANFEAPPDDARQSARPAAKSRFEPKP